jgi:general secretion pathway protein E
VHSTLYDALRAGASDVHLETLANGLVVRYRIDGVLVQMATVTGGEVSEQVISRIKVMAELDISERRVPQDAASRWPSTGAPSTSVSRSFRACSARTRCCVFSTSSH